MEKAVVGPAVMISGRQRKVFSGKSPGLQGTEVNETDTEGTRGVAREEGLPARRLDMGGTQTLPEPCTHWLMTSCG